MSARCLFLLVAVISASERCSGFALCPESRGDYEQPLFTEDREPLAEKETNKLSMARRVFLTAESDDHSDYITASQGDFRYVNENEIGQKGSQFFVTKPAAANLDMATHRIVNCGDANNETDVVTLRGLTPYYRKGSPLDMNRQQIKNLAPGLSENDAATIGQCSGLLRAYDVALSKAFEALGKSSGGSGLVGTAVGGAAGAGAGGVVGAAGAGSQTGSSLLSAGGSAGTSIVFNTANVIGNAIVGQVQDLRGKFVSKPIAEHLIMTQHQIKLMADGTDESDAVAMSQLRTYVTSETAQFALKSELPSTDAYDLRYVKESELGQKGAQLFVTKPVAANLDMATHRITNVGAPVDNDDAVTLQHLSAESIQLQRLISTAVPRLKHGFIFLNRHNTAIILKGPSCVPVSLMIRSPNQRLNFDEVYIQKPVALVGIYALFVARDRLCNGMPYNFYYYGAAGTDPTSAEREAAVLTTES